MTKYDSADDQQHSEGFQVAFHLPDGNKIENRFSTGDMTKVSFLIFIAL